MTAPEVLVCLDTSNECTLMLENHGCEPVYLEPGQELGQLVGVALHVGENAGNNFSAQSVNCVVTGSPDGFASEQEKQKRLCRLFELLKTK